MSHSSESEPSVSGRGTIEHVESELFGDVIDSLNAHIERKSAVANEVRYAVLYLMTEQRELTHRELLDATGLDEDVLQTHLTPLIETNLLARINAPVGADDRHTTYRITTLGRQEINADIKNIHPDES